MPGAQGCGAAGEESGSRRKNGDKKRQQTINKRNRERAIEEKRTLKRQGKEEKARRSRTASSRSRTGSGLRTNSSTARRGAATPNTATATARLNADPGRGAGGARGRLGLRTGPRASGAGVQRRRPGADDRGRGRRDGARAADERLPEPTVIHWHGLRVPAAMDGTEVVQRLVQPGEASLPLRAARRGDVLVPLARQRDGADRARALRRARRPRARTSRCSTASASAPRRPEARRGRATRAVRRRPRAAQRPRRQRAPRQRHAGAGARDRGGTGRALAHRERREHPLTCGSRSAAARSRSSAATGADRRAGQADRDARSRRASASSSPSARSRRARCSSSRPCPTTAGRGEPRRERFATIRVAARQPSTAHDPATAARDRAARRRRRDCEPTRTGEHDSDSMSTASHTSTTTPVKVGELQVWELVNETSKDHPFHLHGFFFQVLAIDGSRLRRWKDTVNVPHEGDRPDRVAPRRPARQVDVPLPHPRAPRDGDDGALQRRDLTVPDARSRTCR